MKRVIKLSILVLFIFSLTFWRAKSKENLVAVISFDTQIFLIGSKTCFASDSLFF